MTKFVCSTCGYVHEDITAPENCPICMAPSSDFSEINDEAHQTAITQPDINDEGEVKEANETERGNAVELDHEEYSPNLSESSKINENENLQHETSNNAVSGVDQVDSDEELILKLYKEANNRNEVIVWFKTMRNVELKEAKDRVDSVMDKYGLFSGDDSGSGNRSGGGCMVTILIAISSSLSAFFML